MPPPKVVTTLLVLIFLEEQGEALRFRGKIAFMWSPDSVSMGCSHFDQLENVHLSKMSISSAGPSGDVLKMCPSKCFCTIDTTVKAFHHTMQILWIWTCLAIC